MLVGEILDELANPRPELVREVRRRGADERVDVVEGGLGHAGQTNRGPIGAKSSPLQCQAL
jgi:hypothetical protein